MQAPIYNIGISRIVIAVNVIRTIQPPFYSTCINRCVYAYFFLMLLFHRYQVVHPRDHLMIVHIIACGL